MDTLQQVKLDKIENLLQVLVNLLDKKSNSNHLEIITQKEVLKELNISPNTLKSWERKGLARLEPPIKGKTSLNFYQLNSKAGLQQTIYEYAKIKSSFKK